MRKRGVAAAAGASAIQRDRLQQQRRAFIPEAFAAQLGAAKSPGLWPHPFPAYFVLDGGCRQLLNASAVEVYVQICCRGRE